MRKLTSRSILLVLVLVSIFYYFPNTVQASSQRPIFGFQAADTYGEGCNKDVGAIVHAPEDSFVTVHDTDWIEPDCWRVSIQASPSGWDRDFRLGIAVIDKFGGLGTIRYTPWASDGGGYSGWAYTGPVNGDMKGAFVIEQTRSLPAGKTIDNVQIGIQVGDNTSGSCNGGSAVSSPWSGTNPGNELWSSWGHSFSSSPECLQLHLGAEVSSPVLPKLSLSKIQSTLVCNSASCPTSDNASVLNIGSGLMNYDYDQTADSANVPGHKWFSFINKALASSCSGTGFLSSILDGLCGDSGIGSNGSSQGSFAVTSPQQSHIGTHNGNIVESCNPLNSCEASYQVATLGITYIIEGPAVDLKGHGPGALASDGPITVNPGDSVVLSWISDNTNATNPIDSSDFGAGTANGSITVTPNTTTTYHIRVQGLSDIDTSENNFANDSILVCVGTCNVTPTPTATSNPTSTPTPTTTPAGLVCSPSSQSATLNQTVSLSSSGGVSPYFWSTDSSGNPFNGVGPSFSTSYSTAGPKTISLSDSAGGTAYCAVAVDFDELYCAPNQQEVDVGEVANLVANGGEAPYVWSVPGGSPPAGAGDILSTTFSAPGSYEVALIDNQGAVSTCSVEVVGTTPTPTATPTSTPTPTPSPNQPPSVPSVDAIEPDYCTTGPAVTVTWTYSDPDGDAQSAYQVQVDDQGSFASPEIDTGKIIGSGTSYFTGNGSLGFNVTYKTRVRVWDSHDAVSAWEVSGSWKTPKHAYPQVNFAWTPVKPLINQVTQFTDTTVFSDGVGFGQRAWAWLFGDGGSSAIQNPTHSYSSASNYNVTETVTDKDGYVCSLSKILSIQKQIPIWKEVSPGN